MVDVQVRNVSRDLLRDFDAAIEGEYSTRAEAIRDLMRHYVEDRKRKPGPNV